MNSSNNVFEQSYGYSSQEMHQAFDALSQWINTQDLPSSAVLRIRVIAEELMSNIIRHNHPKESEDRARIKLSILPSELVFELTDSCAPFNPIEHKDLGYGLTITNNAADRLTYEQCDGFNLTTATIDLKRRNM